MAGLGGVHVLQRWVWKPRLRAGQDLASQFGIGAQAGLDSFQRGHQASVEWIKEFPSDYNKANWGGVQALRQSP